MVAAALGIPSSLAGKIDTAALPNTSSSFNRQNSASGAYNRLLLLQEARSRLVFSIDYRHQHALSTIICHLSFALALQTVYMRGLENETEAVEPPSQVAQLALLSTLNALLTHEPKPPPIIRYIHYNVLCPHWPCIKPDCGWRRCWAFAPGLAFSANFAHWATKTPNTAS